MNKTSHRRTRRTFRNNGRGATDILAAQLLRQVDATAASQGGGNQDASNYLNAYAAAHPGETIGKDQWGNAVPLFGAAAGYQRNDSTIFSAAPQTTNQPPQLGLGAVGGYFAGMGQGLADTIGHPLDTLWGGVKGAYGLITDPQDTAQQMQEATRAVVVQAGEGNFKPSGEQVGQQVGLTVVGTVAGVGTGKAVAAIKGKVTPIVNNNAALHGEKNVANRPTDIPVGISGSPMKVEPGTNVPTTINGINYSGHALDQMQGRGVPPSVLKNVIKHGVVYPTRAGTVGYYDKVNNIRIITNANAGRVVIVIPGAPGK